jgi:hypothetical protein
MIALAMLYATLTCQRPDLGARGRTHFEAGCKSVTGYDDCGEDERERDYDNGQENEYCDQQIHWHSRQSVGHVVPAIRS